MCANNQLTNQLLQGQEASPAVALPDVEMALYINSIVLEALSNKLPPAIKNHLDGVRLANKQLCMALLKNQQGPSPATLDFVKGLFRQHYGIDLTLDQLPVTRRRAQP